jgi:hypothetical protein
MSSSFHQVEMSLLGLESDGGSRHSEFVMDVCYADVGQNNDDDDLVVEFMMKWRAGIVGKDQLSADNLDSAYYARRMIAAEYQEKNLDKPTGTSGFDIISFQQHDTDLYAVRSVVLWVVGGH